MPHYGLPVNGGIWQSFVVGNVLFLLTDTRSQKIMSPAQSRTMLGETQEEWLKGKLLEGKSRDLIVWINSVPRIGKAQGGKDFWAGFDEERQRIAHYIKSNNIRNICMLSGDAHMLAIDDGSNSGYASGDRGGFPVFQSAAFSSRGSKKGGRIVLAARTEGLERV